MTKNVIICIDDEKVILTSLKSQLKKCFGGEFIYETAENANEGFELVDEHVEQGNKIMVIISDWLMPDMKGDEFFIEINKKHPKIIKILLTGQADSKAIERAYNDAGIYGLITKPWSENDLVDVIQNALRKMNE
jgi:response regulator RpfG family c-di-GMP phosphodiesterase